MNPIYGSTRPVTVRPAGPEDSEVIREIRNHAVEHSTALWTTRTLRSPEEGAAWLAPHLERGSAFVAVAEGEVTGFAVYGPWKDFDGFRDTMENSVYVREGRYGLGIGSALLDALVTSARDSGHHSLIAGIEAENAASVRLHERFGFRHVGTVPEAGTKFGRWLDLTLMQLRLN
ncbi:N-acetyltransferase family protein [Streptomyces sp. NPDC047973]|uniref:GNAT family N-acetyltransferase n=1 Tax=Streptomyces sp. NPDC047973 TaxID=3155383 RepID=UPI003440B012